MANPNIVNVTSIYGGNAGWNLTATTTTTLLTVAADVIVKVNAITCANVDGTNAATLNLYIDGVDVQDKQNSTTGTIDFTKDNYSVGAEVNGNSKFNGEIQCSRRKTIGFKIEKN